MNQREKIRKRLNVKKLEDYKIFPKYFEIETVNACNARCVMCTINEWTGNDSVLMSDELFNKFVDEVKLYKDWIEIICLNRDGEPTLDKNLHIKVKKLKDVGIKKVRFVTNAQNLTPEFAKRVLKAGIDEVMFSIDSIHKEIYEKIRINLDFEKVMSNTLNYIKLRDEINPNSIVTIRMVEMDMNIKEKENWLKFWKSKVTNREDKVYTMPMHYWGNQLGEIEEKVEYFSKIACISPFSSMAIHSNGKVGICAADFNVKYYMGDFSKQTIKEIWQGKAFEEVREAHLNGNRNKYEICRGCDIWDRDYTYEVKGKQSETDKK